MGHFIALFLAGVLEYTLAALWTRYLVSRAIVKTGLVTFISACLWGFVISQMTILNPIAIVLHAIGCCCGAMLVCWQSPLETIE